MLWESPKVVEGKKAFHKVYVGQILSTKDGLISQGVNCALILSQSPSTAHLQASASFEVWDQL